MSSQVESRETEDDESDDEWSRLVMGGSMPHAIYPRSRAKFSFFILFYLNRCVMSWRMVIYNNTYIYIYLGTQWQEEKGGRWGLKDRIACDAYDKRHQK